MVKKIAIASLSRGIIGEPFVQHEVKLGVKRLEEYGLEVVFTKNALKGLDYIEKNPQSRAQDLLDALNDDSIDMILCAIGGEDTYRLLPYLFEHDELKNAVANHQKIFLGYSDSTMNHLMLHKAGLNTFYGQSFLSTICEMEKEMLPYSKKYFEELINTGTIHEITPSDVWYKERTDFGEDQLGVPRERHENHGFELLQGSATFSGKILGGCIETIYDIFDNTRFSDTVDLCTKYSVFPTAQDWKGKILLLETSEEHTKPELYKKMLLKLKGAGVFDSVNGVIVGKPQDEVYYAEYKKLLVDVIDNPSLSVVYNVNVGHATPQCIVPFGIEATVDVNNQRITFGD